MGKTSYDKNTKRITTKVNIKDKENNTVSQDKVVLVDTGSPVTYIDNENVKNGTWITGGVVASNLGAGLTFGGGKIEVETEKKGGGDAKTKSCTQAFVSVITEEPLWQDLKSNGIHGILGMDQMDNIQADSDVFDRDKDTPGARIERDKEDEEKPKKSQEK